MTRHTGLDDTHINVSTGGLHPAADTGRGQQDAPARALTLDLSVYDPFFEDREISDEDKRALLEALWSIIVGFVDLGFHIHPVQQVGMADADQMASDIAGDPGCGAFLGAADPAASSVVGSPKQRNRLGKAFYPAGAKTAVHKPIARK